MSEFESLKLHPAPESPAPFPARDSAPVPPPPAAAGAEEAPRHYIATLYESRSFIAFSVVITVAVALLYVVLAPPTWESEVVVQLEDRNKVLAGLEELPNIVADKNPADTEIELIKSRSLLGSVVDQLGLTIEARPRTFPVVGGAFVRFHRGGTLAPPPLNLAAYAWGGEQITVTQLDVAEELVGKPLELVAGAERRFQLLGPKGELVLSGEAGKTAQGADGSAMHVRQLVARPGTRFRVMQKRRDAVIDDLRKQVRVAERGKKTGIISIALEGKDRTLVPAILDGIAQGYVLQNVQRKSAEAAKTLEFIGEQLPTLKARVDAAEANLNAFQQKKGTIDLSVETQQMLERTVDIEKALSDLDLQRADLSGRFAEGHPLLTTIRQKADKLRAERATIANKMRGVPEQELDSARLQRDVKVASELYFMLLNKAQELRVVKSGTLGNVRVVDMATRPFQPASPKPFFSLGLGLILGLVGGVAVAFVRRSIHGGMDDPDAIEALTGLPIYAAIAHSPRQTSIGRSTPRRGSPGSVLATTDPNDPAIEALRSLRTNLQFALTEANSNIIAIEGPAPAVGKSFVSCNFGYVLAAFGHKVLLIDCDLRRGILHRSFGVERSPGVSDVISGEATLASAIRHSSDPNLDFVSSGTHRPNPSELLGSSRLQQLLAQASKAYDLVLVDTPPVLAVTDAALIARCAGVNLLVLRSGEHNAREIKVALKRLRHAGAPLHGIIINDALMGNSRYGRFGQYGYYRYEYKAK